MTKIKLLVIVGLFIANISNSLVALSQQSKNQFTVNVGIGKSIISDNPVAGNIDFGYEFNPLPKYDFLSLQPKLCTSMSISTKENPVDKWKSDCVSYGVGLALAPRLSLSNDDNSMSLYFEYEISAFNYFSVMNVYRENISVYSAKSNRNMFFHSRWRCGVKSLNLLKKDKHSIGIGAWIGFTSIRLDNIIQRVVPSQFDNYFSNLPLDGEFGMSFYF